MGRQHRRWRARLLFRAAPAQASADTRISSSSAGPSAGSRQEDSAVTRTERRWTISPTGDAESLDWRYQFFSFAYCPGVAKEKRDNGFAVNLFAQPWRWRCHAQCRNTSELSGSLLGQAAIHVEHAGEHPQPRHAIAPAMISGPTG